MQPGRGIQEGPRVCRWPTDRIDEIPRRSAHPSRQQHHRSRLGRTRARPTQPRRLSLRAGHDRSHDVVHGVRKCPCLRRQPRRGPPARREHWHAMPSTSQPTGRGCPILRPRTSPDDVNFREITHQKTSGCAPTYASASPWSVLESWPQTGSSSLGRARRCASMLSPRSERGPRAQWHAR